jgi:predicted transcriptional regulator
VRQQIEEGLDDVAAGRVTPQEDVRAELLDRRQRAS